jgi:hypothetical protein
MTTPQAHVSSSGNVAHDAADSGNPVKIGGKANTSLPSAVAASDRVDGMFDVYGRLVTVPYIAGASEVKMAGARVAATATDRVEIVAPAAGKAIRILDYAIIATGLSTNPMRVEIYYGEGSAHDAVAGRTIAEVYIGRDDRVMEVFPDGSGLKGPTDETDGVLSFRSRGETEGNTGNPFLGCVVHYREE